MRLDGSHLEAGLSLIADVANGPLTRTDWAEQLLRGEILTGSLKAGERLKIGELQERYPGLSPTPLREALSRLAGSGLVDVLPNRGMRVAPGSVEELRDVQANRALLEAIAFERSVGAGDETWQREVKAAFDGLVVLSHELANLDDIGSAELIRWENAHRRFHFSLLSRCGSPWLLRLVGILYEQSVRYRYLTIRARPEFDQIAADHEAIYGAALSGDPTESLAALRDHLNLTVEHAQDLDEVVIAGADEG